MSQAETGERGAGHYAVDVAVRGLIGGLRLLPYEARLAAMGRIMSRLIAPAAGWDSRVRDNLAYVFPDLPDPEVRRLMRAVPDNFGRAMMEMYSAREFVARMAGMTATGPGLEALEAARDAKRPVLLVTGHFGNYDAPRAWLTSRGYRVGALYNPARNAFFNAHYTRALAEVASPIFPRGRAGLVHMVRFLKDGGMVGIVIDQYMSHGARLDFLGKPAPTALSAAEMAVKYGALAVPIYGVRRPNGVDFDLVVEAPVPHGDPLAMTQALNDSLSAMVRAHMGQWFWIHRRWKPERHRGSLGRRG